MRLKLFATVLICAVIFIFNSKAIAAELELVSYSAQVKLQWLANTGMPIAKKIAKEFNTANIYGKKNLKDYDRLEKLNGLYQEICYAATVQYVQKADYKNIIDIGGGYTPRAITFVNEGRKYFGAELNAIALSATQIMPKFVNSQYKNNLVYQEVLAEDRDTMLAAADTFNGKICIIEEGLQIYLTKPRTDAMISIFRDVLRRHRGCYITTDFVMDDMFKELAAALYGENSAEILYKETKDMYENLFGEALYLNSYETPEAALAFLKRQGFKVQQVRLVPDTSKLYSLKGLSLQQAEKVKKICAKNYLWVITLP